MPPGSRIVWRSRSVRQRAVSAPNTSGLRPCAFVGGMHAFVVLVVNRVRDHGGVAVTHACGVGVAVNQLVLASAGAGSETSLFKHNSRGLHAMVTAFPHLETPVDCLKTMTPRIRKGTRITMNASNMAVRDSPGFCRPGRLLTRFKAFTFTHTAPAKAGAN